MQTITGAQLKQLPRFARLAIELDRINRAWEDAINEFPEVPEAADIKNSLLPKWPSAYGRLSTQLGPVKQYRGLLSEEQLLELTYRELLAHPVLFYQLRHLPFQGQTLRLWQAVAAFLLRFRASLPFDFSTAKLSPPKEKPLVDRYNQAVLMLNTAQLHYASAVLGIEENWFADLIGRNNTIQLLGQKYDAYRVYSMFHEPVRCNHDWLTHFMPNNVQALVFARRDYLRNLLRRELGLQSPSQPTHQSPSPAVLPSDKLKQIAFWWFRWRREGKPEAQIKGYPDILACVDTLIHDIRETASKADCDDIEWYRDKIASALNGAQPV